jgi:hypothetical protein
MIMRTVGAVGRRVVEMHGLVTGQPENRPMYDTVAVATPIICVVSSGKLYNLSLEGVVTIAACFVTPEGVVFGAGFASIVCRPRAVILKCPRRVLSISPALTR